MTLTKFEYSLLRDLHIFQKDLRDMYSCLDKANEEAIKIQEILLHKVTYLEDNVKNTLCNIVAIKSFTRDLNKVRGRLAVSTLAVHQSIRDNTSSTGEEK